jgi:uncharacterized glyoxalase superfamily protein PhnB
MTGRAPDVIPMVAYRDGVAAMDWLAAAFGFEQRSRWVDDAGVLTHGEVVAGRGVIMLATPSAEYEGPLRHREHCASAAAWSQVPWVIDGVLVHVSDIERHFERARRAGATLLSAIEDGPAGRLYRAEDLEGHRWMFVEGGSSSE